MMKYKMEAWARVAGCDFKAPRSGDAGYDIQSAEAVTLFPGDQKTVTTGLRVEIPNGHVGMVKDRSSIAMRQVYTHAGVIDAGFRGLVNVLISNRGVENFHIEPGHRIAQLLIMKVDTPALVEAERLSDTQRGENGFGSTGK